MDVTLKATTVTNNEIYAVVKSTMEFVLSVAEVYRSESPPLNVGESSPVTFKNGIRKFYSSGYQYLLELNKNIIPNNGNIYCANIDVAYILLGDVLGGRLTGDDISEKNIAITVCAYMGLHTRKTSKNIVVNKIIRSPMAYCEYMTDNDLKIIAVTTGTAYSTLNKWFFTRFTLFASIVHQYQIQRFNSQIQNVMTDRVICKIIPIVEELNL
ncbi:MULTISPECIES: hypothetical protein [Photobacterium]|uniref:Uncharacterized protein n=1 Tax=Photobacterium carnosum TaxID=2023717 RepID=A0A2N4UQ10_9GAMM|nr:MULTISPECIES: hypothetical protein [Photobacterium]MBY3789353.1 hypothetical protein [Photobacterium carnosum]MCD9463248.1 hypothetical protein [Photobacterium phosphoreum]MCD9512348.1 hypothetical protein [Photobacterium phosphoreum]MCD9534412.1 hypothetical protein [Photobacterium carnosum]OBU42776.1 hypothetical protein AYY26_19750 [Photobacterium phosphoreum]